MEKKKYELNESGRRVRREYSSDKMVSFVAELISSGKVVAKIDTGALRVLARGDSEG